MTKFIYKDKDGYRVIIETESKEIADKIALKLNLKI